MTAIASNWPSFRRGFAGAAIVVAMLAVSLGYSGCSGLPVAAGITQQPKNQSVTILQPVTFNVIAVGGQVSYQWQRDGMDIPGATAATYDIPSAMMSDNNAKFDVVVSNQSKRDVSTTKT
jgi:hypothetical protein